MINIGDEVLYIPNGCIFKIIEIDKDKKTLTIESEFEIYSNVALGDVILL